MKLKVSLAIMVIAMIAMCLPHDDRFSEAVARGWNWQEVRMGRDGFEAVQVPIPKRVEMSVTLVIEELVP